MKFICLLVCSAMNYYVIEPTKVNRTDVNAMQAMMLCKMCGVIQNLTHPLCMYNNLSRQYYPMIEKGESNYQYIGERCYLAKCEKMFEEHFENGRPDALNNRRIYEEIIAEVEKKIAKCEKMFE